MPENEQARLAEEEARRFLEPCFEKYSMAWFIHGATDYGIYLPGYSDVDFQACFELSVFKSIEECIAAITTYSREQGEPMDQFVDTTSGHNVYVCVWPRLNVDLGILLRKTDFEIARKNIAFQKKAYRDYTGLGLELKTYFHHRRDNRGLKLAGYTFAPLMAVAVHVARKRTLPIGGRGLWEAVVEALGKTDRFYLVRGCSPGETADGGNKIYIYDSYRNCIAGDHPTTLPRAGVVAFFRELAHATS